MNIEDEIINIRTTLARIEGRLSVVYSLPAPISGKQFMPSKGGPMFEFVIEHQFWTAVVIYWIFSAAVSSMPEPGANSNPGYLWLYRFLHSLAGNITTVFGTKIPGLKTFLLI